MPFSACQSIVMSEIAATGEPTRPAPPGRIWPYVAAIVVDSFQVGVDDLSPFGRAMPDA